MLTELGNLRCKLAQLLLDGWAFFFWTEIYTVYSLSLWTAKIAKKYPKNVEIHKNQYVTNVPEGSIGKCKPKRWWGRIGWRYIWNFNLPFFWSPESKTKKYNFRTQKKYRDALFQKKQKRHAFEGLVRFLKLLVSLWLLRNR